jgi:hypothetical protein
VVIAAEQLDSKAAYVACSRGRYEARIFAPEKKHLFDGLKRPADRLAATDVVGSSRKAFWQHSEYIARQRAAEDAILFHAVLNRPKTLGIEMVQ